MRKNNGRRRHRGQNRRNFNNLNKNTVIESFGPISQIRGNVQQLNEKYNNLGNDAASNDDKVLSETYYQFADHYHRLLKEIEIYGIEVSTISVNDQGVVKIEELIDLIKDETNLVSVMMANNEIGAIQPIKKIKQILKKYEIPLHTDAVQALGKIKVDVKELDVDYLALSAHKFYGPKGIGALYVKNKDDLGSLIIGGNQESGVRGGTENISGIIGMGLAAELVTKNQDRWIKNLKKLERYFLEKVEHHLPHAIHHKTDNLPGLISISFPGKNSNILMAKLDRADIAVSNGPACSSGNIKPSSVLKAIGLSDDVNLSTLRISFGKNNTIEEVDYLIKTLKEIV